MTTNRRAEYLGEVAVDSGELLVIDPAYAEDAEMVLEPDNEQPDQLRFGHGTPAAVRFRTASGDGLYPVLLHRGVDGVPTHVVVSLDGGAH